MFAACAAAGTQEMLEAADSSHMHMEGLWNKICSKGKTFTEEQYASHTWLASLSCSRRCLLLKSDLLYACIWLETVAGRVNNYFQFLSQLSAASNVHEQPCASDPHLIASRILVLCFVT